MKSFPSCASELYNISINGLTPFVMLYVNNRVLKKRHDFKGKIPSISPFHFVLPFKRASQKPCSPSTCYDWIGMIFDYFQAKSGRELRGGANLIITMFFFHAKRRLHDKIIAYNSLEFGFSSLYRFILLVYLFFIRLLFWSDSRILFWTLFYIFDTISIDFILNNIQTIFYYIVNSILITLLLIHQLLPAFILTC